MLINPANFTQSLQDDGQIQFNISGRLFVLYIDARNSFLLAHNQLEPSFSKMWRSLSSFFCHQTCNSQRCRTGCPGAAGSITSVQRLIVCCSCSKIVALGFVLFLHSPYMHLFSLYSTSCCHPPAHLSLPSLDIFYYQVDTTVNSVPSKELLQSYVSK